MNIKNGFYSFIFVIFLLGKGLNATITQGPLNSVAETGKEVKFECTADAPIAYWVLSKNGVTSGELKIVGPGCSAPHPAFVDHYSVEILDGGKTCNLNVSNITMEQAGVYRCLEGSADSSSILTVLESSPIITVNITSLVENESVVIECTLNHNGSVIPAPTLRPYFYWTNSIGQNISSSYDSTTNDTAVSQLRVIAGRQNITAYTCHVYLQLIPAAKPNYASNTPAVSSSSSSSAIEVLYYPGNISITSSVSAEYNCVYKQESLTCTAEANPQAQYEWLDLTSNNVTSGSVKSITSGGRYQCTAYNDIRNHRRNETKTATETNCYPVKQDNMTINGPSCTNSTCYCIGDPMVTLTCVAYSIPVPNYQWWSDVPEHTNLGNNKTIQATYDGNYSCRATNKYGEVINNGTVSVIVSNCTAPPTTRLTTTLSTSTTSPTTSKSTTIFESTSTTMPPMSGLSAAGIAIGCILVVNILATSLFIVYYNKVEELHPGTNGRIINVKMEHNKLKLNKSFPWLQKMLPCLNDTKENTGIYCLWVSLFILLATLTGILTFPICILLAKRFEKSQGSSALTNRENCDENGRTEIGRSANSSLSSIQTANPQIAVHDENPYQNCQTEGIELHNCQQSKTRLLLNSPSHGTALANKPQLPLKPNSQSFGKTDRVVNYMVPQGVTISNREGRTATTNQDQTTYGEIFFNRRTNDPVQLLIDGPKDHYATLKKV